MSDVQLIIGTGEPEHAVADREKGRVAKELHCDGLRMRSDTGHVAGPGPEEGPHRGSEVLHLGVGLPGPNPIPT